MKALFFLNSEAFEMMNLETQEPLVSSPGRIRPIIEDDLGAPVPIHVRVWLRGKGGTFAFKLISAFENKQLKKNFVYLFGCSCSKFWHTASFCCSVLTLVSACGI